MPRRLTDPVLSILFTAVLLALASDARAQLRIAQWNITNYNGGRVSEFQTAIYGEFMGRSMSPDLIILQEIIQGGGSVASKTNSGQSVLNQFVAILNTAPGSPGDWTSAPYVADNGDTGNGLVYRQSKFQWLGTLALTDNTGSGSDQPPRDNHRWRMRLAGYTGAAAEIYVYSAHMKAGSSSGDQARRTPESERLRADTFLLPEGANYLLGADLNIQSSSQTAYQVLIGAGVGQFVDPINTPGSWNNNFAFRFVHTQDPFRPSPGAGMDDRLDFILVSPTLRNGQGLSYLPSQPGGNIALAYSTTTWNDPNHSYRSWGNDGTSFDEALTTTGNTMVGPVIAQALIDSTGNQTGHLPVYLDLQVPARVNAPASIDLGDVPQFATAETTVQIGNAVDPVLWARAGYSGGFGLETLTYTLSASGGFAVPAGPFNDAAGGTLNSHTLALDTSTLGPKAGTLTVASNSADGPTLVIPITANVVFDGPPPPPPGNYDVNGDGLIDTEDLYSWFSLLTDVNGNGVVDTADLTALRVALRWYEKADMAPDR